jgi:hypothetical protein
MGLSSSINVQLHKSDVTESGLLRLIRWWPDANSERVGCEPIV